MTQYYVTYDLGSLDKTMKEIYALTMSCEAPILQNG